MDRWTSAFVMCVLGVVALGGCSKKDPEPQAIPMPTAPSATVAADPVPGATPTSSALVPGADTAAANAPTTTAPATPPPSQPDAPSQHATPKAGGGSIDACCSALSAIKSSGKPATVKSKAAAAAAMCSGIAKLVKEGQTSRSAALTQIKSAMVGAEMPGECN